NEYLAEQRRDFTVPVRAEGSPIDRRVWDLVARIPYGQTTTYGAIAADLAEPGVDARAVGASIARNPVCILIPCHRVIGSNGRLTGYAGGLGRKLRLLDLEQERTIRQLTLPLLRLS